MKKLPEPIRALIGTPYDEDSLKHAFMRAGIRQWCVLSQSIEDRCLNVRREYIFISENNSTIVTMREWLQKNLARKLVKDFSAATDIPLKPDLSIAQIDEFANSLTDGYLLHQLEQSLGRVVAKDEKRMMEITKGTTPNPLDRIKYNIDRIRIPYMEPSKASPDMFCVVVGGGVIESVSFKDNVKSTPAVKLLKP